MRIVKSNYVLTFDFNILYIPETLLLETTKVLDLDTMKFMPFKGNKDIIQYSFPLHATDVNLIVKTVLLGSTSYELTDKNMNWLINFEYKLKEDAGLWNNEKYMFNYLMLKLMLVGFPEDKALKIAKSYFTLAREANPLIDLKKMINHLNTLISKKEYWITNKVTNYERIELDFLDKVFDYRIRYHHKFNYKYFEKEYLLLCNTSFSKKNYMYNKQKSYLVKKPKNLNDQLLYIINSYEVILNGLIDSLISNKYNTLETDIKFISGLTNDMKNTLSLVANTWER